MIRNLIVLAIIVIAFVIGIKMGGQKAQTPTPSPVPSQAPAPGEKDIIGNLKDVFDKNISQPLEARARLRWNLAREIGVRAASINIRKKGDTIILSGTVPYKEQKDLAGELAHTYGGVSTVKNNIEVHPLGEKTPPSPSPTSPLPSPEKSPGNDEKKEK